MTLVDRCQFNLVVKELLLCKEPVQVDKLFLATILEFVLLLFLVLFLIMHD